MHIVIKTFFLNHDTSYYLIKLRINTNIEIWLKDKRRKKKKQ